MMAATRSQKRVAGRRPEDLNKNPSNLQKELVKIAQKNKNKKTAVEKQGDTLEQTTSVTNTVPELPFVNVPPLPNVGRGQTKTNRVPAKADSIEELLELEVPKLTDEPRFKNRAPLQADERAKDLVQDALKNTICITTEDLLNVSEPMRQELKKLLMKKRLEKKSVSFAADVDFKNDTSEVIETFSVETLPGTIFEVLMNTISAERLPGATYEILAEDVNGMSKGSVVVSDPVAQYLNALAPGEKPKSVIVAAESYALRTVYPLINGVGEVESLLDPGSQVVSMSKEVATALQVTWDPDIVVHMESANKSLEKTLGLAKNVPFVFGPITVYLQVHVIGKAAYQVLLGRPFDTITESEVKNSRDGSQSLTLTDLNTGERCVMHTHEKGRQPTVLKRPVRQDFQRNSMN
jgi:hypothetical protein